MLLHHINKIIIFLYSMTINLRIVRYWTLTLMHYYSGAISRHYFKVYIRSCEKVINLYKLK